MPGLSMQRSANGSPGPRQALLTSASQASPQTSVETPTVSRDVVDAREYGQEVRKLLQSTTDKIERESLLKGSTMVHLGKLLQCPDGAGHGQILSEFIARIPEMNSHQRADKDDQHAALRLVASIAQHPLRHSVFPDPELPEALAISLCNVLPRLTASKHTHGFAAEAMKSARSSANGLVKYRGTHMLTSGATAVPALLYGAAKAVGKAAVKMTHDDKAPNQVLSIVAQLLPQPKSGGTVSDDVVDAITEAICNSPTRNGVQHAKLYKRLAASAEPDQLARMDAALAKEGLLDQIQQRNRSTLDRLLHGRSG
jgi:hypothetical protein